MPPEQEQDSDFSLSEGHAKKIYLTMVHSNPVSVRNGMVHVDRKFHVGMLNYAENIPHRILTVNPRLRDGQRVMDEIAVPISELPYEVVSIEVDPGYNPLPSAHPVLADIIARSKIVYGAGMNSADIAQRIGVPYVLILEYDLGTQIVDITSQVKALVRKAMRTIKCTLSYYRKGVPQMKAAHSIHCNGYPIYSVAQRHNKNCLLYLDSRMSSQMIISEETLLARLAKRKGKPLRLLFSGRYERLKGADDAVRVAEECLRRGLDIEMHCYGRGTLSDEMKRIAGAAARPERIVIHEAIPYPELVEISRSFDVFVCCHIQSDPSCTYLESMGAGLPIVGYANRMWARLRDESKAGLASPLGKPHKVADCIQQLLRNPDELEQMSRSAMSFARNHCFEREYEKRVAAIIAAIDFLN